MKPVSFSTNPQCHSFPANARDAIADDDLQSRLGRTLREGFQKKRAKAMGRLAEFDQLRDEGRDIKAHVLDNLDIYLAKFEEKVVAAGGHVHWARDAQEARNIILGICKDVDAKTVTKGKSMVTEEIGINEHLEKNGIRPVETDLGEYIIQLRKEPPSHIVAPAFHLSKEQVAAAFRQHHTELSPERNLDEATALLGEARQLLRREFVGADVGITGANMLVAETGTALIVTNEGNGDLTQSLPPVHIAVASIEKIVPTLEDANTLLRLLARSATGQDITVYTTFFTGARRAEDIDGPEQFHIVLYDGGRAAALASEFRDVLRCIKCGACMNHCPVFGVVGGHAYGWVYPGPIGSVLAPLLVGANEAHHLPNASTLCGRCEAVCPVRIPLPTLLRRHRDRAWDSGKAGTITLVGLKMWAFLATKPRLYHAIAAFKLAVWKRLAGNRGSFKWLPFVGGWTRARDFPVPHGETFMDLWKEKNRSKKMAQTQRPGEDQ